MGDGYENGVHVQTVEPDIAGEIDQRNGWGKKEEQFEVFQTQEELLAKFAKLARLIASKRNSKFWWGCFLIATGDAGADGKTMEQFAQEWSVGRACVSQACVAICAFLGIRPSQYMRTEQARRSYRQSNRRNTV